jgi:hypothetical protein
MDVLTLFGLLAVTAMLVCYALEKRSHWFTLAFAAACVLGSAYGFLQGAWPFGIVEAIWALVAFRRWQMRPVLPSAQGANVSRGNLTPLPSSSDAAAPLPSPPQTP